MRTVSLRWKRHFSQFLTFFAFFRRSPGISDGFWTFFLFPATSPRAPIEFILDYEFTSFFWLSIDANLEIVHKYFFLFSNKCRSSDADSEKLETLTLMDSWLHNRSCRPFSSAAPPLGRKRSDHTKSKLQVWNSLEKVKQYMPEFLCYSVGCKWDLRKCQRAHTWVIPMFHLHRLLWISIISRMSFSGVTSTKVTWTGFKNGRACLLRLSLNILT